MVRPSISAGNGPEKALQGGYIPEFDPVHRWFKNIHFFRASRRDIILMADAVPAPPEKQLLNTPSEGFAVSACVRIRGGYLSYARSVFVLQGKREKKASGGYGLSMLQARSPPVESS